MRWKPLPRDVALSPRAGTDHTGIPGSEKDGKCGEMRGIAERGCAGNGPPGGGGRTRPVRCRRKSPLEEGGRVTWFAR